MSERDFCYWLQGFFELNPGMSAPTAAQTQAIREHLAEVFRKVTPPVSAPAASERSVAEIATAIRSGRSGGGGSAVFCKEIT